jgi:hypothetical protein
MDDIDKTIRSVQGRWRFDSFDVCGGAKQRFRIGEFILRKEIVGTDSECSFSLQSILLVRPRSCRSCTCQPFLTPRQFPRRFEPFETRQLRDFYPSWVSPCPTGDCWMLIRNPYLAAAYSVNLPIRRSRTAPTSPVSSRQARSIVPERQADRYGPLLRLRDVLLQKR